MTLLGEAKREAPAQTESALPAFRCGTDRNIWKSAESSEGERPVNKDNLEQSKGIQPKVEFDRSKEAPPQAEIEKPSV